eukprot:TRINITY_DN43528_c0_g1_i1.p1 TRINITY_DN43528_c0_g1~~TRINITY_DN43528_c0_g1_i1.p1  ORF type:complete len:490 (-),score=88.81 TRINITY_DN43528_c0_g1_i1:68-1492(-)
MEGATGDEEWADDEKVRILHGEEVTPWKSWNVCAGPWKFPPGLLQFLVDANFKAPTPIQAWTWPVLVTGKDVIGVAKTGSGKTLGYLLPGYIKVKRGELSDGLNTKDGPAMLVLAPTRELCQQIYQESVTFGEPALIQTACCYGGAPKSQQVRELWKGPQCVVATPGRLKDLASDNSVKLGQVSYLVLDEADRMLDMGFEPQIKAIADYLPTQRQSALFTATWPREVREVASRLTHDATHVQVGSSDSATTNADITQHIIKISSEAEKMRFLEDKIFSQLQQRGTSCLIFTRTKKAVAQLFTTLQRAGAPIVQLHGDMEQRERDNALWAFKNGKAKLLVATDVAQRGLDIKNVACVVNYDAPQNMEDYVHRIGRTGRAGEKGDSYTFLYENQRDEAMKILKVFQKSGQAVPQDLKDIAQSYGGYGGGGGCWGGGRINPEFGSGGDAWGNWTGSAGGASGGGGGGYGGKGGKGGW